MSKKIKLRNVIQIIIAYGLVLVLLLAFPFGFIKQTVESGTSDNFERTSMAIYDTVEFAQDFQPQYSYLESISFYVKNELQEQQYFTIEFYLFNDLEGIIYMEQLILDGEGYPGIYKVLIEQYVDINEEYRYVIRAPYEELFIGYVKDADSGAIETGNTYMSNELDQGYSGYAIYEYKTTVMPWWIFAYVLCAMFLIYLIGELLKKVESKFIIFQKQYDVNRLVNGILILTVTSMTIWLMISIFPQKLFGSNVLDIIVYECSAIVAGGVLIYYFAKICKPYLLFQKVWNVNKVKDYLQILCFCMVILHCCNYMNATYQYTHDLNIRKIIVYLLLVIALMIDTKQLLRMKSLIAFSISTLGSIVYYVQKMGMEHTQIPDRWQSLVQWEAYRIPVAVLVIYHLIRIIYKKRVRNLSYVYGSLLILFWIVQNYYANGRTWQQILVFPIGAYYLFYCSKENKTNTMYNFMYGVVYHFIGMILYSLVHRPYHYYMHTRYSMYFHTVTITSMYLVLVFCVCLVLLLNAYGKKNRMAIPVLMILLGASVAYIFMTISRLGILTLVGIGIGVVGVLLLYARKIIWRVVLTRFAIIMITMMLSIPVFFMYTRIVPAVTNDPVMLDIEVTAASIYWDEPMDSSWYVTVERYLSLLFERYGVETEEEVIILGEIASRNNQVLYVSNGQEESKEEAPRIDTNGRVDIWKAYIGEMNLTGHEIMGALVGEDLQVHAHNSFLQVMHDHGLITGILFIILYVVSIYRGIMYYRVNVRDYSRLLPITMLGAFGIVSVAEWIFHPCNPLGLGFLLSLAPLLLRIKRRKKV
ncbi:MAG: hypothetical protein R3Y54_00185 [Eubacteriales bacterium]